jgi:hypothetical protein
VRPKADDAGAEALVGLSFKKFARIASVCIMRQKSAAAPPPTPLRTLAALAGPQQSPPRTHAKERERARARTCGGSRLRRRAATN